MTHHDILPFLEREAPRYTSYPTAHHFSESVNAATHEQWLSALAENDPVAVYAHIPFCNELCWFCGCHTKMTKRYEPIAAYVQVLLKEIAQLKQHTGGRGKLTQIHFGGGSPSLLEGNDLTAILDAIATTFEFTPPGELAIELDPRTTSPENIALYAALGFNRVSIGIQDFDATVQAAINRIQPFEMVASVMDGLRVHGIHALNCDLIYGLPHQTQTRFRKTLEQTLSLEPSRIALFSYAHLPQLKKHQRLIPDETLPSALEKLQLYATACEMLDRAGYVAIGIDHYARADDALALAMKNRSMKRNFQGYVTEIPAALIGVGCSSISQFAGGYVQNHASTPHYRERIERGELATARGVAFMGDDLARKQVIDEIMCFMNADLATIARAHGLAADYFTQEAALIASTHYAPLARCEAGRVEITTPYRMAARVVASLFDAHAVRTGSRYSKVA